MTRAQQLLEKYVGTYRNSERWLPPSFELFVNPSPREMAEFRKSGIRWIADSKKRAFYVWGANGALHPRVAKEMGIRYKKDPNIAAGEAAFMRGGWYFTESDYFDIGVPMQLIPAIKKQDWSWTGKYVKDLPNVMDDLFYDPEFTDEW